MTSIRRATPLGAALLAAALGIGCASSSGSGPAAPGGSGAGAGLSRPAGVGGIPAPSPIDPGGHELLGDRYLGEGEPDLALFEYREALRLEPGRVAARYKAGRLLLRRGFPDKAEAEFRTLLETQPGSALAWLGLGHAAFLAGDPEAEGFLHEALARDGSLWQAHNLLGLIRERAGAPAKAVVAYEAAIAINPGEGALSNNLGVALLSAGDAPRAVLAFRRAVETGAREPRVYNNLGLALARLGRDEEALAAFGRAGSRSAALNNLGFVLLLEGKPARAVETLRQAVAADPGYFDRARRNLERALAAQKTPRAPPDPAP